jgi:hypothetical protein
LLRNTYSVRQKISVRRKSSLRFPLGLLLLTTVRAQIAPPNQEYVANLGSAPFKAPATVDFAPGATFTMEGWFYLTNNTPFGWLMGKGLATSGVDPFVSFGVFLDSAGSKLSFNTSTGVAGSARGVASPAAFPLRVWTHVAAVQDNGVIRLLINGSVVATGTPAGSPLAAPNVSFGVGVAYQADGSPNFANFPGLARQVRFWNVARTAAQISAALSESLPTDRTGLVAAWPLDESSGANARDLSGAGRTLSASSVVAIRTTQLAAGPFYSAGAPTSVVNGPLGGIFNSVLIDFDSDGDADLIILDTARATFPETRTRLRAFRNNVGTFVDATDAVLGNVTMVNPRHAFAADFNGDGLADLLVVGHGTDIPPYPGEQSRIFIRTADGRLVDETATRLPQHASFTHNVAVADIDGDGDLDIYMCNIGGGDANIGPRFYLNNGTGVFTEATNRIPQDISDRQSGHIYTASLLVDVNGDGRPDLVLGGQCGAFGGSPNELLMNDGTGHFVRDSRFVLPPKLFSNVEGVTVAIGSADFNGDGKPDLVLATSGGTSVINGVPSNGYGIPRLQLLLNRGDGTFADATATAGFTWSASETCVFWPNILDFDGDGRPDILAEETLASPNFVGARIFLNRGNGTFVDASSAYTFPQLTEFVHAADFDRDGQVDLVTASSWISPSVITVARGLKRLDQSLFLSSPTIVTQPQSQAVGAAGSVNLTVAASSTPAPTWQWQRNGTNLTGATGSTFALASLQPAGTGLYTAVATSDGSTASDPAIVGVSSPSKVLGTGNELQPTDIQHPNGNIFDQVLLSGAAATITADPGQITRLSYVDLTNDIVQVEFSGAGSLSVVLDNSSGPALPTNYNQAVNYMKGHAGIVIVGANETTNVSVFSVGRATAVNQALFKSEVTYDGVADLAFIAIASANGRFGGVRTANAHYFAAKGLTGIYAPGVQFDGPVFVGDINASDAAIPALVLGAASDTRITGGDLFQTNGRALQVSGLTQLKFTAGGDSHGTPLAAKSNRAVLQKNGTDVTAQVVVNPTP